MTTAPSNSDFREPISRVIADVLPTFNAPDEQQRQAKELALQWDALRFARTPNVGAFAAVLNHPQYKAAARALSQDPQISAFMATSSNSGPFISHPLTGGAVLQPDVLAMSLVLNAITTTRLDGQQLTRDDVLARVMDGVRQLGLVAAHNPATAQLLFVFDGIPLANEQVISTPWGLIRPASSLRDANGNLPIPLNVDHASAVLISPVSFSFDVSPTAPPPEARPLSDADRTTASEPPIQVLLAILLATVSSELAPCRVIRQTSIVPWSAGWGAGDTLPPAIRGQIRTRPLTASELRSAEVWMKRLKGDFHPSLELTAHRVTNAAYYRHAPADRLIDAVTAWESLFGARAETTFRVTASLAKLLGYNFDLESRLKLQKSLAAIYDARSSVVHGQPAAATQLLKGQEKTPFHVIADLALRVALLALAELFEHCPELVALEPADRTNHLLIAGSLNRPPAPASLEPSGPGGPAPPPRRRPAS